MQICDKHWAMMHEAIKARGLWPLVANGGAAAAEALQAELAGQGTPDTYDPLMACTWMVTTQALEAGGLYLLGQTDDGGSYCPICEAMTHMAGRPASADDPTLWSAEDIEHHWINGPADAALAHCRAHGLVAGVQ